jgi:hypothetical protein
MLRPFVLTLAALIVPAFFAGCGSDDKEPTGGNQNTGGGQSTGGAPSGPPPAYDCSAYKWMDVTDACWSCMCGACKPTLDACNTDCTDAMTCAKEEGTLVNVASQLNCEIRATLDLCLTTPAGQAAAQALIAFDTCLILAPNKTTFRACDVECATPYPGDVCERYPEPPPMQ